MSNNIQHDANNAFVNSFSLGGKSKPFNWAYTYSQLVILRWIGPNPEDVQPRFDVFTKEELDNIIITFKNKEFTLDNKVDEMNDSKFIGMGAFIKQKLGGDNTRAQAASQIAAIMVACKVFSLTNPKVKRGMKFKVSNPKWNTALSKVYKNRIE